MICSHPGCEKAAHKDGECYRHRIASVGINLRGGAIVGNNGWNTTKRDWLESNMGVSTEKELSGRKDIERA